MNFKSWLLDVPHSRDNLMRWCVVAAGLGLVGPSRGEEVSLLKAGVARVNLTPPMEMKAALGGYGARMSKPAIGVHDAVWTKALVPDEG
jgi:hypothetical protein